MKGFIDKNVFFDGNLGWLYVFFHRAYAIRPHAVLCMTSDILPSPLGDTYL